MRSDHKLALDLLTAVGVSADRVTRAVFTFDIEETPTLDVTYLAWPTKDAEAIETTVRFVPEVEA